MESLTHHLREIGLALAPAAYCFLVIAAITKRGALVAAMRAGWRESRTNAGLFAINYALFVPIMAAPVLAVTALVPNWREISNSWPNLPFVVEVALALVMIDVAAYWRHRFEHTSFMWRFHATHHADEALNWFSVSRKHPVGKLFEVMIDIVPALLLGCPLIAIAVAQMVRGWWGFLIHADVPWTLGPLGSVLISPAAHRLHHIRDESLMGNNYGNTLTVWDRVFGTWADPAPHIGCATGIAEGSRGIWGELIRPFTMDNPAGDAAFTCARSEAAAGERVDRALQDDRSGVAVDHFGAVRPAGVLRDQMLLGAQRRPALVPEQHREREPAGEIAGIGAARLGARTLAAVHVAGQADHDAGDRARSHQLGQPGGVDGEFAAWQGFAGGGVTPARIAGRDADGACSDVEPEKRAAVG
jgi:sterol desaturase/sphingolipid hydroxylase (fatty acid hydroxylase superfamily)